MRTTTLILGFVLMQATATAKNLGMFEPKHMYSNLHSKHQGRCDQYHDDSLSMHSFAVTMDCSYQCKKDAQTSSVTLSRYFDPDEHGLEKGDGYTKSSRPLMAGFSAVFFSWSTKECLEEGARKCGSIEELKSADFKTLSSGSWSISEKPTCKQNDRVLYSPYDPQFKLERAKNKFQDAPGPLIQIPDETPVAGCKFKIKGDLCFGDCLLIDDTNPVTPFPMTLMTKETPESGFSTKEVCGDPLVNAFQGKKLSAQVAESICQNYFMNSLVKAKVMGTSCSAFRGQANCKKLVKQISR